jgi:hypothetical protein
MASLLFPAPGQEVTIKETSICTWPCGKELPQDTSCRPVAWLMSVSGS